MEEEKQYRAKWKWGERSIKRRAYAYRRFLLLRRMLCALVALIAIVGGSNVGASDNLTVEVQNITDEEVGNWRPTPTPPDEIPEFTTIAVPVCMLLGLFWYFRRRGHDGVND